MDTPRPQPGLRDGEPFALSAQEITRGHPDLVERHLAFAGTADGAVHRHRPHDRDTRAIPRHEEQADAPVPGRVRVRDRHDDEDRGVHGPGREPFPACDHIRGAIPDGGRLHLRRIRAGRHRLSHGEAAPDPAVEQGLQPLLLLSLGPELGQDFHVSRVGCRAVEHLRRPQDAPHHLGEWGVFEVGQPRSIRGVGQEKVPEAGLLRLGLQLLQDLRAVVPIARRLDLLPVRPLVRVDEPLHEVRQLLAERADLRGGGKVHRRPPHIIVRPPETERAWPVMKPASSEAKKITAGGRSSGWPSRPKGITRLRLSASFGFSAVTVAKSGVSVGPGQTQFTLIRWRASSRAIVFVKAMIPPLAAEYTASPVEPTRPASEAMLTIFPYPFLIISSSTARVQTMGPLRLIARTLSQVSSVDLMNGSTLSQPALLTRMWTVPHRLITSATIASIWAFCVMSAL